MLFDKNSPLGGDVLFYVSKKPHGKAIEARQYTLGFDRPELIHAAMMVDSRVLVQATTKRGVHYVPLFEAKRIYKRNTSATILRHRNFTEDQSALGELWRSSYYFYNQNYDWIGALHKDRAGENKKICSTLVQMILSRIHGFSGVVPPEGDKQIYPAELYGVLRSLGFEEVGPYHEPPESRFGRAGDLSPLARLKTLRQVENLEAEIEHWSSVPIAFGEVEFFRGQSGNSNEQLLRIVLHSIPFDGSLLKTMQNKLDSLRGNLETYQYRIARKPLHWSDDPKADEDGIKLREVVEYQIDLTNRQIADATKFLDTGVGDYLRQFEPSDFSYGHIFEAVFKLRFLDAGSAITEMLERIRKLLHSAQHLDDALRGSGFDQGKCEILTTVNRFLDVIFSSQHVWLDVQKSDPILLAKLQLAAEDMCSKLWGIVEGKMSSEIVNQATC